jgi:hypothetical protein
MDKFTLPRKDYEKALEVFFQSSTRINGGWKYLKYPSILSKSVTSSSSSSIQISLYITYSTAYQLPQLSFTALLAESGRSGGLPAEELPEPTEGGEGESSDPHCIDVAESAVQDTWRPPADSDPSLSPKASSPHRQRLATISELLERSRGFIRPDLRRISTASHDPSSSLSNLPVDADSFMQLPLFISFNDDLGFPVYCFHSCQIAEFMQHFSPFIPSACMNELSINGNGTDQTLDSRGSTSIIASWLSLFNRWVSTGLDSAYFL